MNAVAYLHPVMQNAVSAVLRAFEPRGSVTSTYRSIEEQRRLRTAFERGRARFPAERPGNSTHHTGLAVDFVVRAGAHSREQAQLGQLWQEAGGRWSANDPIHFEHPQAREALSVGLTGPRWWLSR